MKTLLVLWLLLLGCTARTETPTPSGGGLVTTASTSSEVIISGDQAEALYQTLKAAHPDQGGPCGSIQIYGIHVGGVTCSYDAYTAGSAAYQCWIFLDSNGNAVDMAQPVCPNPRVGVGN